MINFNNLIQFKICSISFGAPGQQWYQCKIKYLKKL